MGNEGERTVKGNKNRRKKGRRKVRRGKEEGEECKLLIFNFSFNYGRSSGSISHRAGNYPLKRYLRSQGRVGGAYVYHIICIIRLLIPRCEIGHCGCPCRASTYNFLHLGIIVLPSLFPGVFLSLRLWVRRRGEVPTVARNFLYLHFTRILPYLKPLLGPPPSTLA